MKTSSTNRAFNFCFLLAFGLAFWPVAVRAQTPISCGQTINSSIAAANQVDQYTYAGTAGQTRTFAFWSSSACGNGQQLLAAIYSPSFQLITTLDVCGGQSAQSSNLTLATTGTYHILVSGSGNTYTGSYALDIQSFTGGGCDSEAISCGQTINTNLTVVGQINAYAYAGTAGQTRTFAFWSSSACGNGQQLLADIYSPSGQLITTLDVCGGQSAQSSNLTLATTGTYTILVYGSSYSYTGSYALDIQSFTGGGCDSEAISCGQTINTNLTVVGQINAYAYAGTAGQTRTFAFWSSSACGNGQQLLADIYSPSGQLITTLDVCGGQSAQSSNLTLATTGTYTILVYGSSYSYTGSYALDIQSFTGGGCDSEAISCGQTINTNLTVVGQINAYAYAGTAGQTRTFAFWSSSACGNGQQLLADIYSPSGQLITTLDVCGGQSAQSSNLTLATTGTYTILVYGSSYSYTGNYGLGVQSFTGGGCNGEAITCGQTGNGNISQAAQIDAYLIYGCSGELVQFSTSGFSGSQFDLYDPTGNKLFSVGPGTSSNITFSISGSYTLLVHSSSYGGTGQLFNNTHLLDSVYSHDQYQFLATQWRRDQRRRHISLLFPRDGVCKAKPLLQLRELDARRQPGQHVNLLHIHRNQQPEPDGQLCADCWGDK